MQTKGTTLAMTRSNNLDRSDRLAQREERIPPIEASRRGVEPAIPVCASWVLSRRRATFD
jgi:hypothetical protein